MRTTAEIQAQMGTVRIEMGVLDQQLAGLDVQLANLEREMALALVELAARFPSKSIPELAEIVPLAEMEKRLILRTVAFFDGDVPPACRALGIGKTTIYRKLAEYEAQSGRRRGAEAVQA